MIKKIIGSILIAIPFVISFSVIIFKGVFSEGAESIWMVVLTTLFIIIGCKLTMGDDKV